MTEVQATVRTYDATARSGTVLLDDGVELAFPAGTLDPRVRFLRLGQRMRIEVEGLPSERTVARLTLATLDAGW